MLFMIICAVIGIILGVIISDDDEILFSALFGLLGCVIGLVLALTVGSALGTETNNTYEYDLMPYVIEEKSDKYVYLTDNPDVHYSIHYTKEDAQIEQEDIYDNVYFTYDKELTPKVEIDETIINNLWGFTGCTKREYNIIIPSKESIYKADGGKNEK